MCYEIVNQNDFIYLVRNKVLLCYIIIDKYTKFKLNEMYNVLFYYYFYFIYFIVIILND